MEDEKGMVQEEEDVKKRSKKKKKAKDTNPDDEAAPGQVEAANSGLLVSFHVAVSNLLLLAALDGDVEETDRHVAASFIFSPSFL